MKNILTVLLLSICVFSAHGQKVALIGVNHESSTTPPLFNGISILALEDLTPGEVYYFTENEYDDATDEFVDITESVLKITISATIAKGNVIFVEETSTSNTFTVSVTAGSVILQYIAASGNFSIAPYGESLYLYSDNDDDPSNGITEVHSAFFGGLLSSSSTTSGGPMPSSQNPIADYPNAIIIHNFPQRDWNTDLSVVRGLSRIEYKTSVADRTDVNKVQLENSANYVFVGISQDLSTTFFTNLNLSTTNPVITLTKNTNQLDENNSSNFEYTFTSDIVPTTDLAINFSINNGITAPTAIFGSDFTQVGATSINTTSGTITIASGTTSKVLTISPTADSDLEPDEILEIRISSGTGYDAGSPSVQRVTILNDDSQTVTPDIAITGTGTRLPLGGSEEDEFSFSFVALTDLTAGSSYFFSSNSFIKSTLSFNENSTFPSELKWTAPTGISRGDVIVVKKTAPNTFALTCNGESGASCGTVTKLRPAANFYISKFSEVFIAHTDTDDNPYNGISDIQSLVYTYTATVGFGGTIPNELNLTTLYTGAVLVDGFPNTTPGRLEYKPSLRPSTTVDLANFENPSNWLYGETTQDLSPTPFNNIIISEGSTNPTAIVTVSTPSIVEDTETATYTFSIDEIATSDITINFSVSGNAIYNADYTVSGASSFTTSTGSILISSGTTSAQLSISPIADSQLEKKEDILLTLTSGTGYDGGSPGDASVDIINDDVDDALPKLAIIGINHENPSSISLVAMETIPEKSIFYLFRNKFDEETLSFAEGGKLIIETPNKCIPKGTVLSITGNTTGPLTVHCNGTSGTVECGTATISDSSYEFNFLSIGTRYHVFQDSDEDHTNGISQIHAVFHTGGTYPSNHTGGNLPPDEDFKAIYSNAVVVDGFPNTTPNRTEFSATLRATDVSIALIEDISNYVHGQANNQLSTSNFNLVDLQTTAYVDANATGDNDGTSWTDAYTHLQDALTNLPQCISEIWVAEGTYTPIDETTPFTIPIGVSVYGGFNGTETSVDERDWAANPTILSGDLDNSGTANTGDAHTVVRIAENNVTLDGFILEHGYADGTALEDRYGAGMLIRTYTGAHPENTKIINCVFRNNHSNGTGTSTGGAVAVYGNNHQFINSLFYDNSSTDEGGAMSLRIATNVSVINCTFTQNNSNRGGGVFIHTAATGTTTIINSVFAGNTATTSNSNVTNRHSDNTVHLSYSLLDTALPTTGTSGGEVTDIGNNLLLSDPLFTNTANNDFTLQATSPAIDKGNNTANTQSKGLGGNGRIKNGSSGTAIIDLGAYETLPSPPTDLQIDGANTDSVNENRLVGAVVGVLTTTDSSTVDSHSYSLVTGAGDTDNASFSISGNQLLTNAVFDFENKNAYSIRVRTTDTSSQTYEEVLSITINDITNETNTSTQTLWNLNTAGDYTASSTLAIDVSTGIGQLTTGFFSAANIEVATDESRHSSVADFNADGTLDIYVSNNFQQNKLWLGDGAGNWTLDNIEVEADGSRHSSVADFNTDGNLDIYVSNYNQQNKLWLGDGAGNWTLDNIEVATDNSVRSSVADFNADGNLDIYVLNFGQNKLWLGDGAGNWTLDNIEAATDNTLHSSVADFNADGKLDIYVSNFGQNKLWLGDGAGNWTLDNIEVATDNSYHSSVADFNADGKLDIYVSNNGQNKLWLGDGAGNWTLVNIEVATDNSYHSSVADFNADGHLDIYVSNYNGQNKLWLGDGAGNWTLDNIEVATNTSYHSSVADFNGDGTLDIYVSNSGQQNKLWINGFLQNSPYITANTAQTFTTSLTGFTETLSANNQGTVTYQVSTDNGTTWNYWNGTAWTATTKTGGTETSSATVINTNIGTLDTDGGAFLWRAFFHSNGTQRVELDQVEVSYATELPMLSAQCNITLTPPSINAYGGTVTATTTDVTVLTTQGTHTLNWLFGTSGSVTATTASQTVVIQDTTPPDAVVLSTINQQCAATLIPPTTTDNCAGIITATTSSVLQINSQGSRIISWTFADGNGNSLVVTQTVVINDSSAPIAPVLTIINTSDTITLAVPTALDNCSGMVTGQTTSNLTISSEGTHRIVWTFTDGVGNQSTAEQVVVLNRSSGGSSTPEPEMEPDPCDTDTVAPVAPVLAPISDSCEVVIPTPTALDTCSGSVQGTTEAPLTYSQVGDYSITWIFTDSSGNQSSAVQEVSILYDQEVVDVHSACESFEWIDGVRYTEDNNTATYETTDAQGCITLHRLELTLDTLEQPSIALEGNALVVETLADNYQWLDCDNGNTPIAGAIQPRFTPDRLTGNYAVRVTKGSCVVTSECKQLLPEEAVNASQAFSPNGDGINETWHIEHIEKFPNASVRVFNKTGNEVFASENGYNNDWNGAWKGSQNVLPSGSYFYTVDREGDGIVDQYGWLYIQK